MSDLATHADFDVLFNARGLTPRQVADSFVPPPLFVDQLAGAANAIVVGPRGTGKTTLLRMLQQTALEHWDHPEADKARARVTYTAAFVATDKSWSEQIDSLADPKIFDDDQRQLVMFAAFTGQVLLAVVSAMMDRLAPCPPDVVAPQRRVVIPRSEQASMVSALADVWHLELRLPSLAGLRQALNKRASDLYTFVSKERVLGASGRPARLAQASALHLDFRHATVAGAEIFNDAVGEPDGKWALLCDELELAPDPIRNRLLGSLRGSDPRLVYKLSLAPYSPGDHALETVLGAMAEHDFVPVSLAYGRDASSYLFCQQLVQSVLKRRGWKPMTAAQLLGSSGYDAIPEDAEQLPSGYGVGSRWVRRFKSLARKDPSFAAYLSDNDIDLASLPRMSESERAATARKIGPLVAVRDEYWGPRGQRTRKSSTVPLMYTGDRSFFAMVEGNPRYLIGIVTRLLDSAPSDGRIKPAAQARELAALRNRFRAFLATIPLGDKGNERGSRGLLALLDAVGRSLQARTMADEFDADPPGSFVVDASVPESIVDSLGIALTREP